MVCLDELGRRLLRCLRQGQLQVDAVQALGAQGPFPLLLGVEFVQLGRQALGQSPGVDEDQRRAVLEHELEQAWVHRRPDRASRGPGGSGPGGQLDLEALLDRLPEVGHVLDGHDHLEFHRLGAAGVDDGDRTRPAVVAVATQEPRDLL